MTRFLIKRPVAVIMSFLLLAIMGALSLQSIKTALLPDVDIPKLHIVVQNPGYSAPLFERLILAPLREHFSKIPQVKEVESIGDKDVGVIDISLHFGTNMELAFIEANDYLDEALAAMDVHIKRPKIVKYSLAETPSIYLSIRWAGESERDFHDLSEFSQKVIKNRFDQAKEVAFADMSGFAVSRIEIQIKESALQSLGVTLEEVKIALSESNVRLGNVEVRHGHYSYKLLLENEIHRDQFSIGRIIVKNNPKTIRISDIGVVSVASTYSGTYFSENRQAISIALVKNPSVREDDFVLSVEQLVSELMLLYPDVEIQQTKSQSRFLQDVLSDLQSNLVWGLVFAVFVTIFFLKSWRNVVLVLICVIASLLVDFLFMYIVGLTINIVSISGMILGIGLMIDNIIIVLDNIEQKVGDGFNILDRTADGINELIVPLISSTLTTCSIFFPLIYLSGLAGILFYDQAVTVTISLVSSFAVSIVLLPTLYVRMNKNAQRRRENATLYKTYEMLEAGISKRFRVIPYCAGVVLLLGILSLLFVKKEQLPRLSAEEVAFKVRWGRDLNKDMISAMSRNVIDNIAHYIDGSEFYVDQSSFISKTQRRNINENETLFIVQLKQHTSKADVIMAIQAFLNKGSKTASIKLLPEENAINSTLIRDEYNLKIWSHDPNVSSSAIATCLRGEIPNVKLSLLEDVDLIELSFREDELSRIDLSKEKLIDFITSKVGKTLSEGMTESPANVVINSGITSLHELLNTRYLSTEGHEYYLRQLVDVNFAKQKSAIEATAAGRCETVYVDTERPADVIEIVSKQFQNARISFGGDFFEQNRLKNEFVGIGVVTLFILYVILTIQFESLKLPFIVLIEIPFDIAFALFALYITGHTLNIMSFIGLIIMCGIVINDSILKVDLINRLRICGQDIKDAVHSASRRRLKAILMTTSTTVLAVVPTMFQNDTSSQLQTPLLVALVSGLVFGTFVSIFIIPRIYKIVSL